jgi:hypothetical protein
LAFVAIATFFKNLFAKLTGRRRESGTGT